MARHIPELSQELLLDWIEGRLSQEEATKVAAYVAEADEAIQADVGWLQAFVQIGKEIAIDEPPPQLRNILVTCFAEYTHPKSVNEEQPNLLPRLVATLAFDSGLKPITLGVRTGQTPKRRLVTFSTEAADVTFSIQSYRTKQYLALNGQILPRADIQLNTVRIQLFRERVETASTVADELGEFIFDALQPDTYAMILSTQELSMVIETLDLRQ